MSTQFISLDTYYLELMKQNVSMIRQTTKTLKPPISEPAYEPTANNYSSISQMGKQFASYYQDIKKTNNEEALNGLRQVAIDMASNSDSNRYMMLKEDLNTLKEIDPNQYINFFQTANSVGNQYHDFGSWIDSFISIDETEQQSQFIDTSKELIEAEGSALEVNSMFSDFLDTIQRIVKDEDQTSKLDEFFQDLSEKKDTKDFQNVIDTYIENKSNPT
ncbi:MAG: hypothetical protein JXR88_04210 [Clostridia bacterium]|nr:hypothetical protein [Clostridia bacterium]